MLAHLTRWSMDSQTSGNVIHYHGASVLERKRAWARVVHEAGLGPDVTPHILRYTSTSSLLWQGLSIWKVGGINGTGASTVERVDGHHRRIETLEGWADQKTAVRPNEPVNFAAREGLSPPLCRGSVA